MLQTNYSPAGFSGWVRLPGQTWQIACSDPDHGECLARLMQHSDGLRAKHKDLLILRSGELPNGPLPRAFARTTPTTIDFVNAGARP